ncbi:MAG: universal stress protein [Chloroflexota bacterium]
MYRKILVPMDGSETAESALSHVRAMSKASPPPEIVLLSVVEPKDWGSRYKWGDKSASDRLTEELKRWEAEENERWLTEAGEYLTEMANLLAQDGITVKTAIVQGTPAEAILDYARENRVDLIIMATHGRSGTARWALGSVTDKIMRAGEVPVLVVTAESRRKGQA